MIETPDVAILDADIIAYKAACWAESNGSSIKDIEERLTFDVNYWTPPGLSRRLLAFSCSRKDNFRKDFWPSYKANRNNKPAPKLLPICKRILCESNKAVHRNRLEADDIIGLGMGSMTMIGVSLDKDLMTCPGWFWNPEKMDFPRLISVEAADYCFHKQWLMGDSTDNIPGIPKIGKVKAEKLLKDVKPSNRTALVLKSYEEKGLDLDYCLAQARCVRILRFGEWDKESEKIIAWAPNWALTPESKRN
tara:strand:- start:17784 stop:18530 length:747 start_codon:yes stop_codon:yes gene_type:complete